MDATECPICGEVIEADMWSEYPEGRDGNNYDCLVCGNFHISRTLILILKTDKYKDKKHILSGVVANTTRRFDNRTSQDSLFIDLHTGNVEELINNAPVPQNPVEMMKLWLLFMYRCASEAHIAQYIDTEWDYPFVYAHDQQEFKHIIGWLIEDQLLDRDAKNPEHLRLTKNGWLKAEEWSRESTDSNRAFVAMWFDKSMDEVFGKAIKPALEETGFHPVRIDRKETNAKIDDEIIAEIRRSGLVVADFTSESGNPGGRAGVYYEAGFAMGLGIPVIRTIREDQIDKVHFDTRQYSHLKWSGLEDLKEKLVYRIRATIPGRQF